MTQNAPCRFGAFVFVTVAVLCCPKRTNAHKGAVMADNRDGAWQRFVDWLSARRFAYGLATLALMVLIFGFLSQLNVLNWIELVDQFIGDFYANTTAELLSIAWSFALLSRNGEPPVPTDPHITY